LTTRALADAGLLHYIILSSLPRHDTHGLCLSLPLYPPTLCNNSAEGAWGRSPMAGGAMVPSPSSSPSQPAAGGTKRGCRGTQSHGRRCGGVPRFLSPFPPSQPAAGGPREIPEGTQLFLWKRHTLLFVL